MYSVHLRCIFSMHFCFLTKCHTYLCILLLSYVIVGDGLFFHSHCTNNLCVDGRITLSLRLAKSMHKQCIPLSYDFCSTRFCFSFSTSRSHSLSPKGLHSSTILQMCIDGFVGVVHAAIIFDRPFHIRLMRIQYFLPAFWMVTFNYDWSTDFLECLFSESNSRNNIGELHIV